MFHLNVFGEQRPMAVSAATLQAHVRTIFLVVPHVDLQGRFPGERLRTLGTAELLAVGRVGLHVALETVTREKGRGKKTTISHQV